jgi:hypothetical protein
MDSCSTTISQKMIFFIVTAMKTSDLSCYMLAFTTVIQISISLMDQVLDNFMHNTVFFNFEAKTEQKVPEKMFLDKNTKYYLARMLYPHNFYIIASHM